MITQILLNVAYFLLTLVLSPLSLLPTATLPDGFTGAVYDMGGYYISLNKVIPIDALIPAFLFTIIVISALLVFKLVTWLIERLPFVG